MIVEQMPGFIEANDVTDHLKFGYWPSYNIPYSKNVSKYAEIENTINKKPERNMKIYMDYNTCSRANIMRRDQHNITDIDSMKKFMQYNDYMLILFLMENLLKPLLQGQI